MSSSDRRFATDGSAYNYADFVEWYDAHANQMWESAAATEHSESSPVAIDALPALEQQAAFTTTGKRWLENATEMQAASSGCNDAHTAVQSDCGGDWPRDATEHSPGEKALSAHASNALVGPQDVHENSLAPVSASLTDNPLAPSRDTYEAGQIRVYMVGTGTPRPGWNKDDYADVMFELLLKASQGNKVLPAPGQNEEWLRKCFLRSETGAGTKSWKYFKTKYREKIELDSEQQWVRVLPSVAENGDRTT